MTMYTGGAQDEVIDDLALDSHEHMVLRRFATDQAFPVNGTTFHGGLPMQWLDGAPVLNVRANSPLAAFAKRSMDVVISTVALVLLSPLLLLAALAIKATSPGPVLFVQQRDGLNGVPFSIFKFRTMRSDQCDASGILSTRANDSRITPLGAFLRKTSIDELPQLANVFLGTMSLIGPRPHVPGMKVDGIEYEKLVPYYYLRMLAKPGLSGWAQANGLRGGVDSKMAAERIKFDIAYIENYSVLLDLKIIVLTVGREFLIGSGS